MRGGLGLAPMPTFNTETSDVVNGATTIEQSSASVARPRSSAPFTFWSSSGSMAVDG